MQSVPETHYGLVTREGHNPRLSLAAHEGVSLTAERIAW